VFSCKNSNESTGTVLLSENKAWLDDFEILKKEMTLGYANLKYATEKEDIDLVKLNEITILKLKKAKTIEEAQNATKEFLKTFDDGHLRAKIIKAPKKDNNENVETESLKNTDSGVIALKKMGFQNRKYKNRIKYDSVPGYSALNNEQNPFPAAIIKGKNETIGIIRIGFLGHWRYWDTALSVWESYKKTFVGECDGNCQWSFELEVEKELTNKIIDRINELKSKNISKLLVDVSSNGGGSEWVHAVAELFTKKQLKGAKSSFIKHKHWENILKNHLNNVETDLENTKLKQELIIKLKKFKKLILDLISQCENNCNVGKIWNEQDLNCLDLIDHPFSSSLPFDILKDPQIEELNSKYSLSTYRFKIYKKGVYDGPLFIIQDKYSASATEEFTSLLQSNNAGIIIGENSQGLGCGYSNGGIKIELKNIALSVRMPDCVRYRKDGKNEIYGINPDIKVNWDENGSMYSKGLKIIKNIEAYSQVNNSYDVIEKMKSHYSNKWYTNLTFIQKTSFYRNDTLQKQETWYEAMKLGLGLVIKFETKDSGNGYMFKKDSMYVFKNGALINSLKQIHDILELGFNVYKQEAKETIDKLKSNGLDFSYYDETDTHYKIGNPNTKQVWIEKQRFLFTKIESIENGGIKTRVEFNKYTRLGKGWIATEVLFYRNDKITLKEEYFDIKNPKKLPSKLFIVDEFKSAKW